MRPERNMKQEQLIRALLIEGNDAHKWHNWETTTPIIRRELVRGGMGVTVSRAIEDVAHLEPYDVLVLNYCNWKDPTPLSERARLGLTTWLSAGGGLIVLHFSNGAFHHSMPEAGASDWPEYRRIVRRVWNWGSPGGKPSSHDAFGLMTVEVRSHHPIVDGLSAFEIEDELYFEQDGVDPIEPLITAKSKTTRKDEPMAWAYAYGSGRVFQTLLGHSEKTYAAPQPGEMLRRAAIWAAKRELQIPGATHTTLHNTKE